MDPKSGWKTTEFWFSLAACALGFLMASGVITDGSTWSKIVGGAVGILASLGYVASRTKIKDR